MYRHFLDIHKRENLLNSTVYVFSVDENCEFWSQTCCLKFYHQMKAPKLRASLLNDFLLFTPIVDLCLYLSTANKIVGLPMNRSVRSLKLYARHVIGPPSIVIEQLGLIMCNTANDVLRI